VEDLLGVELTVKAGIRKSKEGGSIKHHRSEGMWSGGEKDAGLGV